VLQAVPNIIVMREPVPDEVAQKFLRCFLEEFVQGKPLNRAVRRAREGITYLENKFPGATWLPIIFQNSAAVPLTWQQIQGITIDEELQQKQSVSGNSETKIQSKEIVIEKARLSSNVVLPLVNDCQICGVVNPSTSKFCNNCGFDFSTSIIEQLPDTEIPILAITATPVIPNELVEIASLISSEPHSGLIICPNCNHVNPESNIQCEECYTPLSVPDDISAEIAPLVSSEPHSGSIICPNCNHPNPESNVQCEACYNPLTYQTKPTATPVSNQKLNQTNSSHENQGITYQGVDSILGGRYKILRHLGSGGFSTTFLAEDMQRPGNPVCVVKKLRTLSFEPYYVEVVRRLFASEAQVLEMLGTEHNQIPQLLAYFEENQEFYLIQEFVDGHDLNQEILPGKQFSESEVVVLLLDVLKILEFVHQNNVIHRDIKPSNIIRRYRDQKLVLIDFGAVKEINSHFVDSTINIGTFGYTPPEQLVGRPNFCSDIYAVGIIGIQALTGLLPLEITQLPETDEVVWHKQAQISDELAIILDKMVCYNFIQRYQTVREVIWDLERLNQVKNTNKSLSWYNIFAILVPKKQINRNILITIFIILTCFVTGVSLLKVVPKIIKYNPLSPTPVHQNYDSK
jgi:serine/threonine-protein kinase